MTSRDWHHVLIKIIRIFYLLTQFLLRFNHGFLLHLDVFPGANQFLRFLSPCTKMIFIQHHAIPVEGSRPFVFRLHASALALAQEILKGTEADEWLVDVDILIGLSLGIDELPTLEILMAHQVFLPSLCHGRLEGKHQQSAPLHAKRQLIGSKSLAESHLAIPEEMRSMLMVMLEAIEIFGSLVHGFLLLRSHRESFGAVVDGFASVSHGKPCLLHILLGAAEPFASHFPATHSEQHAVHLMIGEDSSVLPHRRFFEDDVHRVTAWLHYLILLMNSGNRILGGIAHLEQSLQVGVMLISVSIDFRLRLRFLGK